MPELNTVDNPGATAGCLAQEFASTLPMCVEEVLSTMFFAEVIAQHKDDVRLDDSFIGAGLSFCGSVSGRLSVAASHGLAAMLAADFSGSAGEVDPQAVELAIGELANMICGSTLSRVAPEADVTLSHPELTKTASFASGNSHSFTLPDGELVVSFEIA